MASKRAAGAGSERRARGGAPTRTPTRDARGPASSRDHPVPGSRSPVATRVRGLTPAPPPQLPRAREVRADPGPSALAPRLLPAPNPQLRRGLAPTCRGLCAQLRAAAEPRDSRSPRRAHLRTPGRPAREGELLAPGLHPGHRPSPGRELWRAPGRPEVASLQGGPTDAAGGSSGGAGKSHPLSEVT